MFINFRTFFFSTILVLYLSSLSLGQNTTLFFDDMDSYTAGTGLACQNSVDWDTWSNAPCGSEDPLVSSNFAASGINSTVITQNNDLIHRLGDRTSGKYNISFQIYIPAGKSGYFNTMSRFDQNPQHWAMEVFFDAGGSGTLLTGDPDVAFTWVEDTWQDVAVVVDLDSDLGEFWFAGSMVHSWTWTNSASTGTGPLMLAVNDIFGAAATDEMYFDNYRVQQIGPVPISWAIEDLDGDFVPDHLGDTVTVQGVVFTPNYQTTNNSFYIDDGTAGTDIFMFGPTVFNWNSGDLLEITGTVDQFNGVTEIIPADTSGWVFISSGNPTPTPIVLTLAQYKADPEAYEGSLIAFESLTMVGGTWPSAGGSATVQVSDGTDTLDMRIDSDTDIDDNPEPAWPKDIIGVGSQFDNNPPYDTGYQLQPRYYATDFLPLGSVPVELTSFTAQVNDRVVLLSWSTATEQNNHGFEIERKANGQFRTIGFVEGSGTTTEVQNYSFADSHVEIGTYYYRLKQVDFNGLYKYSDIVDVKVIAPDKFALQQNYPNPFNPSTRITFNLAVDSKVSLKIFDVLGQEITNLITANLSAGVHDLNFDASGINSGVYFYRIEANGIDGSTFTDVKKMILTK